MRPMWTGYDFLSVNYSTIGGLHTTSAEPGIGLHMMPRRDGVALGGTAERGEWSIEPNEEAREKIVAGRAEFRRLSTSFVQLLSRGREKRHREDDLRSVRSVDVLQVPLRVHREAERLPRDGAHHTEHGDYIQESCLSLRAARGPVAAEPRSA